MRIPTLLLPLSLLVFASAPACGADPPALQGLDPVELVSGKEVRGLDGLRVERGRFRYAFASEANRKRCLADPAAYAIRMGGACARMGPLSGFGNPDRWHVHQGRIFVFASEQCRTAFKAAPERYQDTDDNPPQATATERKRGAELVELALRGFGGRERVDSLKNLRQECSVTYGQGADQTAGKRVVTLAFPGLYRAEDTYGASRYGDALNRNEAFRTSGDGGERHEEEGLAALVRTAYREPLMLLRSRREPGFTAVSAGKEQFGGVEAELLRIGFRGATTTFALDPASGRILRSAYRDRTFGYVGDVVKRFSDFRSVQGLILPFGVELTYDGKPVTSPAVKTESIRLNESLDPRLFAPLPAS